eukprot:3211876-Rhodomonas_salina.1
MHIRSTQARTQYQTARAHAVHKRAHSVRTVELAEEIEREDPDKRAREQEGDHFVREKTRQRLARKGVRQPPCARDRTSFR